MHLYAIEPAFAPRTPRLPDCEWRGHRARCSAPPGRAARFPDLRRRGPCGLCPQRWPRAGAPGGVSSVERWCPIRARLVRAQALRALRAKASKTLRPVAWSARANRRDTLPQACLAPFEPLHTRQRSFLITAAIDANPAARDAASCFDSEMWVPTYVIGRPTGEDPFEGTRWRRAVSWNARR